MHNRYAVFFEGESDLLDVLNEQRKTDKKTKKENAKKGKRVFAELPMKDANEGQADKPEEKRDESVTNTQVRNREESTLNSEHHGKEFPSRDADDKRHKSRYIRTFVNTQRTKRLYDRQSGSDKTRVKPVEKREGNGTYNWGSHNDVIEVTGLGEGMVDMEKNDSGVSVSDVKEPTHEAEVEETEQFTLDEWRAQHAASGNLKPIYNIRKAGEGENLGKWKKMYVLKKKDSCAKESEGEESDLSLYPQRVGRQRHVYGIQVHFNDLRGRRLRLRRGPWPDSYRQQEEQSQSTHSDEEPLQRSDEIFRVDNELEFPSLQKTSRSSYDLNKSQ